MKNTSSDILIIGAGLSGLTIGYYLNKHNISFKIIEARKRIGGRIYTKKSDNATSIELGATWITKEHSKLIRFLKEFNLELFEQHIGNEAIYEPNSMHPPQVVQLPPNTPPSYRIKGGTDQLINSLASSLNIEENIITDQPVKSITEDKEQLIVECRCETFRTKKVISTIPPHLFASTIPLTLPSSLLSIANNTHTWMGESIKIGLTYNKPFWKKKGTSGTIFSSVGPISEMYDHSNKEKSLYALKGFFNSDYHSISKDERVEMVLNQLRKYYGNVVNDYISYEEMVWKHEPFTSNEYKEFIHPHQNNGHPIFQEPYLNGKLFFSGSETSPQYAGYMEGAIQSAQTVVQRIINKK